ncbi:MAG TPA: M20/M25/M40 family metallo-hydrolase, partial [Acidimicrobiales bacterium]|nr:M20/M25/M40 family metallo-hydrolase [Acidimicrobiales bacterium]
MTLLDALRARTDEMLHALDALVSAESPTSDIAACDAAAKVAADLGRRLIGAEPTWIAAAGRHHLHWSFPGERRLVLIGHLDTVWPLGTLARWPFAVSDGRATGPGAFDMKAGFVQCLFALAALDDLTGIDIIMTTDEETGSSTSRQLVEEVGRG